MTYSFQSEGAIVQPSEANAELAEGAELQVTILAIVPENEGMTKTIVNSDGSKTTVPADSGNNMVLCEYPDGSKKNHQVLLDGSNLAEKVLTNIKGKYGVKNVEIDVMPAVEVGAVITVKGVNHAA